MNCCNKENNVKQGTSFELSVNFSGEEFSLDDVSRIDFVFKQRRSANASAIKTSVWKSDETGDAARIENTNTIIVPFNDEETYRFKPDEKFYMDTRISMADSLDNPLTEIVEQTMSATLFEEELT